MEGIIYRAYLPSGISYIGQTKDLQARIKKHWASRNDKKIFHNALKFFGRDAFVWEVLEVCDIDDLNDREIYWINYFESFECGFNHDTGGYYRRDLSDDTITKMSINRKGKGHPHTEETRKAISESNIGKVFSEEHKSKLRKPKSEETKKKLSEAHKGIPPWNKGLIGVQAGENNGMYGKHHSEEARRKQSIARKEYCRKKREGLL